MWLITCKTKSDAHPSIATYVERNIHEYYNHQLGSLISIQNHAMVKIVTGICSFAPLLLAGGTSQKPQRSQMAQKKLKKFLVTAAFPRTLIRVFKMADTPAFFPVLTDYQLVHDCNLGYPSRGFLDEGYLCDLNLWP